MAESASRADTPRRTLRNGALLVLTGALVGAAIARVAMHRATAAPVATPAVPDAPVAYVPTGASAVLLADVARLRAVPALAPYFSTPSANEPCEARLVRGVDRIAIAVSGSAFDDVGVAFAGALPRDELVACVRARRGGTSASSLRAEPRDRAGFEAVTIEPAHDPALLPSADAAQIVYLPGGVVLAGSREMVERMEDRGRFGARDRGGVLDGPLGVLGQRLGAGHAVELRVALARGVVARTLGAGNDAAFAHVTGVAVGASFERGGLDAVAVLACDDFDAPRAVADALGQARDAFATQLGLPFVASALRATTIERGAADVRVHLVLGETTFRALVLATSALIDAALRAPEDPPPPAVPDR